MTKIVFIFLPLKPILNAPEGQEFVSVPIRLHTPKERMKKLGNYYNVRNDVTGITLRVLEIMSHFISRKEF